MFDLLRALLFVTLGATIQSYKGGSVSFFWSACLVLLTLALLIAWSIQ